MGTSSAVRCRWGTMHALTLMALVLLAECLELAGAEGEEVGVQLQEAVFCVAKADADSERLQEALDWACGEGNSLGSVDCSAIQSGGSCFEPDTVANHASYAFTLYYLHQNSASDACDFKGLATLTSNNPSSGTCVYPTSQASPSSSSSASPDNSGSAMLPSADRSPFSSSPAPSPNAAVALSSFSTCPPFSLLVASLLTMVCLFETLVQIVL